MMPLIEQFHYLVGETGLVICLGCMESYAGLFDIVIMEGVECSEF